MDDLVRYYHRDLELPVLLFTLIYYHFVSFPSGSKDGGTQKSLWLKTPTDPANPKMNAKSQRWGIFTRSAVFITVFQGLMHPIVLMAISDY